MTRAVRLATLLVVLCGLPRPSEAANLCVKSGGNDNTAKASISYVAGNEAGSTCWASIGRAAWGNAARGSSSTTEAADAGDTVYVFGGTYSYSATTSEGNHRHDVLYTPRNDGSAGNYITFTCVGTCRIAAQHWNGPVAGCGTQWSANTLAPYTKWFADVTLGYSWAITSHATQDDAAGATEVYIAPDTGPVVIASATGCWVEGFVLDGGDPGDPYPGINENYPGIRLEECDAPVVRNNTISRFTETSAHGVAINNYHCSNVLIEHNRTSANGVGYMVKNNNDGTGIASGTVRFNWFDGDQRCIGMSIVDTMGTHFHETNHVIYQNVCNQPIESCFFSTGEDSFDSADVFNNTCYHPTGNGNIPDPSWVFLGTYKNGTRFWNNIIDTVKRVLYSDSGASFPGAAALDLEHNIYSNVTTAFYTGGDGTQTTMTSFNAAYPGNNNDDPDSTISDPRLANASGGDFRLCTAVGLPNASCVGPSPAINLGVDALDLDSDSNTTENINAGAYITGSEHIGLETSGTVISSGPLLPQFSRKLRKAF